MGVTAARPEPGVPSSKLNVAVYALFAILALLALGWAYGAIANWGEIASHPVRLAYLIADFALVIPAGIVSGLGLLARKRWAYPLFIFALGALLFDTAHGVLYLIWDNYFGVPLPAAFVLLLVLGGYTVYAIRAVEAERESRKI